MQHMQHLTLPVCSATQSTVNILSKLPKLKHITGLWSGELGHLCRMTACLTFEYGWCFDVRRMNNHKQLRRNCFCSLCAQIEPT